MLELDDRRLEVANWPGGEPTLLLLHEALGCVELWRDFPAELASTTGCEVVAYSRQGFGKSSPEPLPRPLSNLREGGPDELGRVLDALGRDRVVLVGHSDGASIALAYAARHDPRVVGVVSMAAHVFVEPITLGGVREAVERAMTNSLLEKLRTYHGDKAESVHKGWWATWLAPEFESWNLYDLLPQIQVPLLALQGEDDQYATPSQLQEIRKRVGGPCEIVLLESCAHVPHREAKEPTLESIDRFVRNLALSDPSS